MDAEDLASHNGCDGEAVERIDKRFPDFDVTAALAFVVETVDPCHVGAFVVPAEHEEILRELELVAEEQEDCLQALLPAVDIIAEEKEVGIGREPAHLEKPDQIRVLPVDVTDDLYRRRKLKQCGLSEEELSHRGTDGRDLGVLEADRLRNLCRVARIKQACDHLVKID